MTLRSLKACSYSLTTHEWICLCLNKTLFRGTKIYAWYNFHVSQNNILLLMFFSAFKMQKLFLDHGLYKNIPILFISLPCTWGFGHNKCSMTDTSLAKWPRIERDGWKSHTISYAGKGSLQQQYIWSVALLIMPMFLPKRGFLRSNERKVLGWVFSPEEAQRVN